MTTSAEIIALMHQRTHESLTTRAVLETRVTMADLLAVLDLCGVVGSQSHLGETTHDGSTIPLSPQMLREVRDKLDKDTVEEPFGWPIRQDNVPR